MKHRIFSKTLILSLLLALALSALGITPANAAGILYAKPATSGSGDCSSWANACTLQIALTGAVSGDEIWVMTGVYKPTTGSGRTATFQLKNGVAVYGGFAGTETLRTQRDPLANITILSGDIDSNDSQTPIVTDANTVTGNTANSYHVVTGTTGATLDGFTITAGNANNATPDNDRGGGMYNFYNSPTVTNVTFSGNSASYWAGGMYNNKGDTMVTNVTFNGNKAGNSGGGMYNYDSDPTLKNVTFSGNSAPSGGGMYNAYTSAPTLTNVTFSGNSASTSAGGMYNNSSNPQIRNTIFWGNSGAQIYNSSAIPVVSDSVVQGGYAGGTNIITVDPLLGTLGNYGGATQTIPLLPGSSAINAGNATYCTASTDQRGVAYVGTCDIGAFESQGFTLTKSGGDNQSATINTAFADNLEVTVSSAFSEPINGGKVTFTAPASGASASLSASVVTIASGKASVSATANGTLGVYNVAVSAAGAPSADFALTNINDPIAITGYASSITTIGATLNGTVNAKNESTTVTFEYGLDTSYGTTVTAAESPVNGTSDTAVSYALTGLAVNTQYHYRVVASNASGTGYGEDATFWTLANPPSGATLSNRTASSVDITFNVNGNPASTEFAMLESRLNKYVQADGTLGDTAVWQTAAAWGLPKTVTGLNVATVYQFNVTARNGALVETAIAGTNTFYTMGTCSSSTVTVTSAADTGAGTLRQALGDICAGGTITFDAALSGQTILLDSGLPITKSMTIDGSALAAQVILDGNNITRPFRIYDGPVNLNSLTFMHGYIGGTSAGGAIWNQSGSTLTITNSTFASNTGLSNNGGAIANNGTLTVINSTFANNTAVVNGGAIYNAGTLTIINSTFSGNSAASGGAIYNNSGTFDLANNILANSTGGDCVIGAGAIGTNVNNLVEDGSCSATYSGDPLLSALGNYGGSSQTLALLPGSPAINAGDTTTCANAGTVNNKDQRGVTRPAACDIGAFESQGFTFGSLTGTPQGTVFNTAFASSLGLTVTSNGLGEPVSGGQVIFTAPGSGASAVLAGSPATIAADGKASVSATANGATGAYNVTASATGATNTATFALTNLTTYAVTYNANGADSGSAPSSQTKIQTVDLTLATNSGNLARNGYTFTGWNTQANGLGTHYAAGGTYTANAAVTLYAEWTANSYTVTFDGNGGGTPSPVSKSATFGSAYGTLATVSRTGYTFNGWFTASIGGTQVTAATLVSNASNHTLYAQWTANSYTVTFDGNGGGTPSPVSKSATFDSAYGTLATVSRTGYTFNGWFTASTGGTQVTAATLVSNASNHTLYAQWTVNTYTLTYTAGTHGSITGTSPQTVDHGASGAEVTAVPDANYHFVSWSDGVLTASRTDANVTGNITVTATFAINTYTLTYTAGANGSITGTSPQTVNHGASGAEVTAVPDANYHFVSWSDGVLTASRTDTNVATNVTVTANFAINTYTLTYTAGANGSITGTSPQTVDHGASGTAVTAVADTGYHFVKWSDDSIQNPRTETNVTGNVAVTAEFAINTYTLTYTAGAHGSIMGASPQTVDHGASGSEVTAVPDDYYHFVSWSDGVLTASRTDTNVTGNITVTASFTLDNNQTPTDISLSAASINENLPIGTGVGTLSTVDPDAGDTFTYSFCGGTDDASFSITGASLNTAAIFDYETKNSYDICIRVTDSGDLTFDKNFTITVTNLAESGSVIIRSTDTQDGWVLESGENTNVGKTLDAAATTLRLGDDAAKKQYRSILSFATGAALPDNATVTKVTLKVKRQAIIGGGNPVSTFQGFMVDIRKGILGTSALQPTDWKATANKTYGPFNSALTGGWYSIDLTPGKAYINKMATLSGLTQIRLRFQLDDNNNTIANYLSIFSGNSPTASRPQLIIEYQLP